jgi:hypothetical protein
MNALKLSTNGDINLIDLKEHEFEYNFLAMQKAIDCSMVDIVHAVNLPDPYCLVVDDEALLVEKPTVNLVASYIYGTVEHGQPICGDVLVMKDSITEDGIETVGLEDVDIVDLLNMLYNPKVSVGVAELFGRFKKVSGND